jgi:hypothetical protein
MDDVTRAVVSMTLTMPGKKRACPRAKRNPGNAYFLDASSPE